MVPYLLADLIEESQDPLCMQAFTNSARSSTFGILLQVMLSLWAARLAPALPALAS